MKTTKTRLFNLIITCSIAVNLAIISALCYIATIDSKAERSKVALASPVLIYVPKTSTSPAAAASVETAQIK